MVSSVDTLERPLGNPGLATGRQPGSNPCDLILGGSQVRLVSPAALLRWSEILLVEDDSARAARRGTAGVTDPIISVHLRVHRIDGDGIRVAAEQEYVPGLPRTCDAKPRSNLALDLLDGVSSRRSVVVCGPAYGCSARFLDGLAARDLDAVVEVRPSSVVTLGRSEGQGDACIACRLLDRAEWHSLTVPVAGSEGRSISYAVATLGGGRVGSGPYGTLIAALTGGIVGAHRGTVFGLCLGGDITLHQWIETVGWARWIRPLVRRAERSASPPGAPVGNLQRGIGDGNRPKLRANITLSRRQDEADAAVRLTTDMMQPLKRTLLNASRALNVVELFAGAGGMGLGFVLAGSADSHYRLVCSAEVNPVCVQTLRNNHAALDGIVPRNTRQTPPRVDPMDLRTKRALEDIISRARECGGADVVIGGPPCQGFSNANRNSGRSSNPHNELVDVFLRCVVDLAPRIFLIENVQGIHWTRKDGASRSGMSVLDHIRTHMAAAGYEVFTRLLDAVWYGVPQYRSRFFVLGIHRDLDYGVDDFGPWGPFPAPTHGPGTPHGYVTVGQALGDLPPIGNGHAADRTVYVEPTDDDLRANGFLSFLRAGAERRVVTDHVTSKHADYVIQRYREIPPGGNWESIAHTMTNYSDINRTHSNIYRRLLWDEPSITIGHYRKSMLVHPLQPRGLSLREAARLQSFPDWFRFAGSQEPRAGGLEHKQQQLANAVCPLVTRAIARFILNL